MPVRRPGGKYRGLIARNKSDAEIAKEARDRLRRATEAAIRRGAARKKKDPLAGTKLKKKEEDSEATRQQRILNMLIGGKKGNLKKFFLAWLTGVQIQMKESLIEERELAWQRTCVKDAHGKCHADARIQPTQFEMPIEALARAGAWAGGLGLSSGTLPRKLAESLAAAVNALPRPQSVGNLKDRWRWPGPGPHGPAELEEDFKPGVPKNAWLQAPTETVAHYKSGRKYKLDPLNMRTSTIHAPPNANSSATPSVGTPQEETETEEVKVPGQVRFADSPAGRNPPRSQAWVSVV
mmetsp:Transcript_55152/g.129499  ORF Transcript_55152/g.129499 Transcript_55152/m.129499 type:complete len:294 (+) Transcript_55152:69-950(+)